MTRIEVAGGTGHGSLAASTVSVDDRGRRFLPPKQPYGDGLMATRDTAGRAAAEPPPTALWLEAVKKNADIWLLIWSDA